MQSHQALVQRLGAHAKWLDQLLRFRIADVLQGAEERLAGENKILLQPMIKELQPTAQAYFLEEIEASLFIYSFDGYEASMKYVCMTAFDEKKEGALPYQPVI